jgi:hypothetical protein
MVVRGVVGGMWDSIAVWRLWPILVNSNTVREILCRCLLLNGALLGGSLLLYYGAIRQFTIWLISNEDSMVVSSTDWIFELFWCWPLSVLAFIFNTLWYRDIFTHLHQCLFLSSSSSSFSSVKTPSSPLRPQTQSGILMFLQGFGRLRQALAEEVVRILMMLSLTALASLCSSMLCSVLTFILMPLAVAEAVGQVLYFCCVAAAHSFHAFDYLWCVIPISEVVQQRSKPLRQQPEPLRHQPEPLRHQPEPLRQPFHTANLSEKLVFLDRRILYFVGFGFSLALILTCLSRFVAAAVYAIVFPCLVVLTFSATPSKHHTPPPLNTVLLLFQPLYLLTTSTIYLAVSLVNTFTRKLSKLRE